ncbi:MAG: hypothetical protein U5K54_23020 [Cytophagales bacterium]|nr:hypothetical protein [Cytophagales bacterium]
MLFCQYMVSDYGKTISGFIALKSDMNTIQGVSLAHLGETPDRRGSHIQRRDSGSI